MCLRGWLAGGTLRVANLQNEETPTCVCGDTMTFFAQIEDRDVGGMNFGDAGAGYAFVCGTCRTHAKFLWQCS